MASAWDRKKFNFTVNDILPDDTNVAVTVTARLFMVKTQSMKKLMLYSVVVDTATAIQRHCLTITLTSNIGPAPDTDIKIKYPESNYNLIRCTEFLRIEL